MEKYRDRTLAREETAELIEILKEDAKKAIGKGDALTLFSIAVSLLCLYGDSRDTALS